MSETEKKMVKKYMIGLFVNNGIPAEPDWVRIRKSTGLELSLNPETQDYDYITDENPTTEVIKYKPSLNQPLVMYKGEPDYDFAFPRFYNLAVGDKAKCEVLIVFMQESVEKTTGEETSVTGYKAWKNEAALTFSSLNAVDSTLTMDINFGGHVERGYAYPDSETKKPVFVKESTDEEGWVDPFSA